MVMRFCRSPVEGGKSDAGEPTHHGRLLAASAESRIGARSPIGYTFPAMGLD
jgi:hypothetical protein